MAEPGGEGQQPETEADRLKTDISKTLEALRPLTPTPPADQLPKGVNADQWADMKNLTDLLDIVRPPQKSDAAIKPPSVAPTPPVTPKSK